MHFTFKNFVSVSSKNLYQDVSGKGGTDMGIDMKSETHVGNDIYQFIVKFEQCNSFAEIEVATVTSE